MSKQTIAVIIGAIVLFAAAVGGTLAFTGGSGSSSKVHTMQNGQTMTGEVTDTPSGGAHTMSNGETMTGQMATMP